MGKLLNAYSKLKRQNSSKIYIFKIGIFCNIFNEDADYVSPVLNLEITIMGKNLRKCGFPTNKIDKYKLILDDNNIDYLIIDNLNEININEEYMKNLEIRKIINEIEKIDLLETSPKESFDLICSFQERIKKIQGI